MTKIEDSFFVDQLPSTWKICEDVQDKDDSVVDGEHIIARAAGPFFVVDGESGNNRFYSKKLWESAISKNMDRISNREMLGTIGHDHSIDDDALREGKISHIVSRLWIDEATKVGMGEVLILNTPAGKSLNTLLRAGVRLKISSRATGTFKGKSPSGSQLIDESSYKLDGFDFVQTPGVATAIPRIIENLENHLDDIMPGSLEPGNQEPQKMEDVMDEKLIQSLTEEKVRLDDNLQMALSENDSLKSVNKSVDELNENLKSEKSRLENELEVLEKSRNSMEEKLSSVQESLDAYELIGTSETLSKVLEELEAYRADEARIGTSQEVEAALDRAETMIDEYTELGTSSEIKEALDLAEEFSKLGDLEEVKTRVDEHSKYADLATIEELDECIKVLDTYADLGTPSQIDSILESFNRHLDESEVRKAEAAAEKLAEEYSAPVGAVKKLLEKNSEDDTKELLEELYGKTRENKPNRYQKKIVESVEKIDETLVTLPSPNQGSRAARLISKRSQ